MSAKVRLSMDIAGGGCVYHNRAIEGIIKKIKNQFPILLLTGQRQVGKTTLLKEFFGSEYSYFTMDDIIVRNEISRDPALFFKNNSRNLILDEIQYTPEIFPYLKMEVDKNRVDGQYLMTDSQVFYPTKGVSESLAGRVGILELQGVSLRERYELQFKKPFIPNEEYIKEREKYLVTYKDIWDVIHRGCMPRLVYNEQIDWDVYYNSYVQTYIERDVRNLTQVADENSFLMFLISIAARSGELINFNSIAQDIGVSNETIKRWTSILETSRVIYLLRPYYNNHLKRAIKTPKVYFLDTGLASYLTRWPTANTLKTGAAAGNIFETFIIGEIIKSFINAGKVNLPIYYYRDKDGKEIDLIIEVGDELYPIEIKMSASPNISMGKNFKVLEKVENKKIMPGIILCQYDRKTWLDNDLIALPIDYI